MKNIIEEERKGKESKIYKNLKNAKWILLIGIILTIISPILLILPTKFELLNFSNTGEIGDTIGGITSPVVNLLGAILVFYALKAQIEANKLIQDQFYEQKNEESQQKNLQYISTLYDYFLKSIDNFTYVSQKTSGSFSNMKTETIMYKGSLGIHHFIDNIQYAVINPHNNNEALDNVNIKSYINILKLLEHLIDKIIKTNVTNEDKEFYKNLILQQAEYTLFSEKINNPDVYYSPYQKCKECGEKHSRIPFIIVTLIDNLKVKINLL